MSMSMNTLNIVNKMWTGTDYSVAFFDFDGTLSLIREGWQDIMIPYFCEVIKRTPAGQSLDKEQIWTFVRELVDVNTGKQTIYQCIELATTVAEYHGEACNPQIYKAEYLSRLNTHIANRISSLEADKKEAIHYLVPGSIELLSSLRNEKIKIYLSSGTDENDVIKEADLLGISRFFDEIYGAKEDYKSFSKRKCINDILGNLNVTGDSIIGFGDGFVEIEDIKSVGGFACGVASTEANPFVCNQWKERRLIKAGADVVVSNYVDSINLLSFIREGIG